MSLSLIDFKPGKLHTIIPLNAGLSHEASSDIERDVLDVVLLAIYTLPNFVQEEQCVKVALRAYWVLAPLQLVADWGS